jgi:hypothetical protein
LIAGIGLVALVRNINEAEKATAQLNAAFAATGSTVGLTRGRMDEIATSIQRVTTVSDDLAKEAQAVLLTFTRVRGEAFERTIKVAADLSARMGTDLVSAVRSVGLALQDPERGLIALRRAGVALSEEQKNLVKSLIESGRVTQAQNVILRELEARFKGSAVAARNTLGGALIGLKNAFGDLFEGTSESSTQAANSINAISEALADPEIKRGIDILISGLAKVVELAAKAATLIPKGLSAVGSLAETLGQAKNITEAAPIGRLALSNPFAAAVSAQFALRQSAVDEIEKLSNDGASAASIDVKPPINIEEFRVTLRKIDDEYGDFLRDMNDQTKTAVQQQSAEYIKLRTTLQFLRDEKLISQEEFEKRLGGALDDALPEFDLNEIRAKYKSLKQESTELSEFMKGVWQGVGNSIRQTFSDAIYEGKLSLRSLVDIARRAVADILSAFVTSGIQKVLKGLFAGEKGIAGVFGFAAGGGRVDRPTIVGEEGRELVMPGNRVMNSRQMAFAGGGAGIVFAPVTNISLIEREDPQQTKREMIQYYESRSSQQQQEFIRILGRSGVDVKG